MFSLSSTLLLLCALNAARAALPLLPAADVAEVGLRIWWREGELLVGLPDAAGRPGLRPLDSLVPLVLPDELSGWAAVGETCVTRPESAAQLDEERVLARIQTTAEGPVVQVLSGTQVLAENALGRPAQICEILLAQADALPGLEVVVAWRMEVAGSSEGVRGVTVYRLPETAR